MKRSVTMFLAVVLAAGGAAGDDKPAAGKPTTRTRTHVVVFDFETVIGGKVAPRKDVPLEKCTLGERLADSIRLALRPHGQYEVIDRLTTQEFSGPLGADADRKGIAKLIKRLAAGAAVYGTVQKVGQNVRAEVRYLDLTDPNRPAGWSKVFSDGTERARPLIAKAIVEAIRGKGQWRPPEYGDEPEPDSFSKPLNVNGAFDDGRKGWDAPDNVSTFIEAGPPGRGKILRIRTDLARDAWLEYRRKLRFGQADPSKPPKIARDTSYGSVAGLEGVHYRSVWIRATPGRRYWLTADFKGTTAGIFFPKIFVKGFRKMPGAPEGLPESAILELGLTVEQFIAMDADKRKKLIERDAKANPMRYVRECYRWYLACRNKTGQWKHYAAPFPPRGGLGKNVEWLQIQVYAYWPPGEYRFDNVHLYKDPNQKAPLPEEPARTPNFQRRRRIAEQESQERPKHDRK